MGEWNQFEANTRLFNVKNTWDENIYTKKIDMSKVSKAQLAKAEKLAREIEGSSSSNFHLQEERGQRVEHGMDEEDLYSGVIREDSYNQMTNNQNNLNNNHNNNHNNNMNSHAQRRDSSGDKGPGQGQNQGQGFLKERKGGRGAMQQQQQQQPNVSTSTAMYVQLVLFSHGVPEIE